MVDVDSDAAGERWAKRSPRAPAADATGPTTAVARLDRMSSALKSLELDLDAREAQLQAIIDEDIRAGGKPDTKRDGPAAPRTARVLSLIHI